MSKLSKFMHLTKVDVAKKRIHGTFTAEVVDKSGEIADYETTKAAMQEWSKEIEKISGGKSLGNIRKMHGKEVCGKAVEIIYDDAAKKIHGVVEANDQTIDEADKGFLNGFSIGGSYAKKWADPVHKNAKRFTPIIAEVSVVDNPCVPDAVFQYIKDASFTVIKQDGTEEMRKFAPKEKEADLTVEQVWQASDGSTHAKKEDALAKNEEILVQKAMQPALDALKGVTEEPKLEKAMHHVAQLAGVVNSLSDVAKSHEAHKGEGHPITEKLKRHVRGLSDTLHAMAGDEADDMSDDHEANKAVIDIALKAGEGLEKYQDDDLKKITAERDVLAKALKELPVKIEEQFAELKKRIKELESQPAPDKVVLTTLVKGGGDDGDDATEKDKPIPNLNGRSPAERFALMNR